MLFFDAFALKHKKKSLVILLGCEYKIKVK